ncbi:MAG: peptide deformylase [Oscillospiraceae bacterium]|nr:peptide deformylase [Oscillospiraceae bacterium]
MAIRNIYLEGDPILRKKCREIVKFDDRLHTLIDDMHETLDKADGVGLAAPQVGICRRLFIMHIPDTEDPEDESKMLRIEAINPSVSDFEGNQHVIEGCLSIPDKWGYVDRPEKLTLKAVDRNGEPFEIRLEGLGAQCAAHETEHLDGELFTDKVTEFVQPEDNTRRRRRK